MTNRDAGIWSYNTASDETTFVFELDENAAGAEFNDPEEPGEWETSGIVEVDPCPPGKSSYLLMFRLILLKTPMKTLRF